MKNIETISFRQADLSDNQQLLRLTEQCPMDGEIPLRIDRNPNFFALLDNRGASRVFVAVNDDMIVGCISVSKTQSYVRNQVQPVYYVADLRVMPAWRGNGIGGCLCDLVEEFLLSVHADLVTLTVAAGNAKPRPFFKRNSDIPDLQSVGVFHVYQILGKKQGSPEKTDLVYHKEPDKKIIQFLNAYYRTYQLGPVVSNESLRLTDIYTLSDESGIQATVCLTDTSRIKQHIVIAMPFKIKIQVLLFNAVRKFLRCSALPAANEIIEILYIKYLAVAETAHSIMPILLERLRDMVYRQGRTFLAIGVHEKDPLNQYFSAPLGFTFDSECMILSLQNNNTLVESIKKGVPFEDYSLV